MNDTTDLLLDVEIRHVIQHWALDRDGEQWDALLLDAFSADGQMVTSWSTLPERDFVSASSKGMNQAQYQSRHNSGANRVDLNGNRVLAATKLTMMLPGELHGTEVDVTVQGVSSDRFVTTERGWKSLLRRSLYGSSRIDAVIPGASMVLDPTVLDRYPAAYRYLAYFQVAHGAKVPTDMLNPASKQLQSVIADDHAWIAQENAEEDRA